MKLTIFLAILTVVSQVQAAGQDLVTAAERQSKDQWVKTHLLDPSFTELDSRTPQESQGPEPGLDVYANNDPVIQNHRNNRPLKLGNKTYSRGLYCHAVSKVEVTLPGPGRRFTAEVGLDHNDDTLRGRGSVVFSVTVAGGVAFRSGIMKVNTPPGRGRMSMCLYPGPSVSIPPIVLNIHSPTAPKE